MAIAKLSIASEDGNGIDVMFNPNTYTITKQIAWNRSNDARANAPTVAFGGGGARELSLELFFDVTESTDARKDVRNETDDLVFLTRIMRDKEKPRPPICTVSWDQTTTADFPFVGLVSSLTQRFTLFHSSGRPLRATVNVTFTEFLSRTDDLLHTDPELTTRTVRRGDKLSDIAAQVYLDPAAWRAIALANRIENPLLLAAGTTLTIPKA
jgi:nucleoid-associated protein YgaU